MKIPFFVSFQDMPQKRIKISYSHWFPASIFPAAWGLISKNLTAYCLKIRWKKTGITFLSFVFF